MVPARGHRGEGPRRWPGLTAEVVSPAAGGPRGGQPAGVPPARRHRREAPAGRSRLAEEVVTPALDRVVYLEPAGVPPARRHRRVAPARYPRLAQVVTASPTAGRASGGQAAGMIVAHIHRHETRVCGQGHLMARRAVSAAARVQRRHRNRIGRVRRQVRHRHLVHIRRHHHRIPGHRRVEGRHQHIGRTPRPGTVHTRSQPPHTQRGQLRPCHDADRVAAGHDPVEGRGDAHRHHRAVLHEHRVIRYRGARHRRTATGTVHRQSDLRVGVASGDAVGCPPDRCRPRERRHLVFGDILIEHTVEQICAPRRQRQRHQPALWRLAVCVVAPARNRRVAQHPTSVTPTCRRIDERSRGRDQPTVAAVAPTAQRPARQPTSTRMIRPGPHISEIARRAVELAVCVVPPARHSQTGADHTGVGRARGHVAHRERQRRRRQLPITVVAPTNHIRRIGDCASMSRAGRHPRDPLTARAAEAAHRHIGLVRAVVAPAHHTRIRAHTAHMSIPHSQLNEPALGRPHSTRACDLRHRRRHITPTKNRLITAAHPAHEIRGRRRRQRLKREPRHTVHHRIDTPALHRPVGTQPTRMTGPRRHRDEPTQRTRRHPQTKNRSQPRHRRIRVHNPIAVGVVANNTPRMPRGRLQRPPNLPGRRMRMPVQHVRHHPRHERRRHRRARLVRDPARAERRPVEVAGVEPMD